MTIKRADRRTWKDIEEVIYSDFDISFDKNPVTGALIRVTNDEAVKQSIRNIVLTDRGEWAHHPNLGSKIKSLLFDPIDPVTAGLIRDAIEGGLRYESRAKVLRIDVVPVSDRDGYEVTIIFKIINRTEPISMTMILKRVR